MAVDPRHRGMLVSLTVHRWTNQVTDHKVTAEVEQAHNAKNAGKYRKVLVPKESLAKIQSAESALRTNHYLYTLSWGDKGDRLLPSRLHMEFIQKHSGFHNAFDDAVREFCLAYPSLVNAARQRLGTMYDPSDYPDVEEIRRRFAVELNWSPIPDTKDFRIDLAEDVIEGIKQEMTETIAKRQKETVTECLMRLREVVEKIHERLSDEDKIFRDSLIENAETQCKLIASLNITDDPEIEELRQAVTEMLAPPQRLRDDKVLRNKKAEEARALLERMGMTYK